MKATLISLAALFLGATAQPASILSDPPLYVNSGTNTTGFTLKFSDPSFTVDNNMLVGPVGGGWVALPVCVTGDFQIDFDVYPDANDAGAYLILFDNASKKGINVANSTNTSYGLHSLEINLVDDLTDHDQFYYTHDTLATAEAKNFPNQAWTHVTIIKKGNTLTDNVGGQVISADLSKANLPAMLQVGLSYYATTNMGGDGQIGYINLRVVGLKAR
jgi:hypothetical protein